MKPNYFFLSIALLLSVEFSSAQCRYIPCTNSAGDTVVWSFTGGSFQSYGCAPIDPTRWLSGNGISILATFVSPQDYPALRVWGMNDDDFASVEVNGVSYPLTLSSGSYAPKVVCGLSPGPDGVVFSGGQITGANTPQQQTTAALEHAIREAGREPAQRDSHYRRITPTHSIPVNGTARVGTEPAYA